MVLLYCPRAASRSRQGVFAEAVIAVPPDKQHKDNIRCNGYRLLYAPIKVQRRFRPTVTASDMKRDQLLRTTSIVRRNFQGTCFELSEALYNRILKLASIKTAGDLTAQRG